MSGTNKEVSVLDHPNRTVYFLLAFFIPPVGIVLGILLANKKEELDRKLGKELILISVIMLLLIGTWVPFKI